MNEDVKLVKYMGREFVVPTWAKFIAADRSFDVYVYAEPPDWEFGDWYPKNNVYEFVGVLVDFNHPCEAI